MSEHSHKNPVGRKVQINYPNRKNVILFISDWSLIVLGIVSAGFALQGFLVPNHFFDGGITGISLLLHEVYDWNLGYVIVLANLPLVIISYYSVS